jgi:hypothetical protein
MPADAAQPIPARVIPAEGVDVRVVVASFGKGQESIEPFERPSGSPSSETLIRKQSMRLITAAAAASLVLSLSGAAWAQGAPGGNGSGGNVTGGSTTSSSAADTARKGATTGSTITTQPSTGGAGSMGAGSGAGGAAGHSGAGAAGGTSGGAGAR